MLSHFLKNKVYAGIAIGLMVTAICAIGLASGLFKNLNENLSDSLYTRNEPSKEIVIIAIDDKSTSTTGLGRFNQWTRANFTNLLKVLEGEGPKVVAIDFVFHTATDIVNKKQLQKVGGEAEEFSSDAEKLKTYQEFIENYGNNIDNPTDREFADALAKFPNLILDATLNPDGETLTKPLTKFTTTATLGVATSALDERGVFKATIPNFYASRENKNYDDIALATVKKFLGNSEKSAKLSLNLPLENGKLLVNFFGEPYSYQMISFIDVLNGDFPADTFKNKIILIGGTSSKEFHDEYLTPRSNVTPMPGIEIIANEIQTILEGKFLQNQSTASTIFMIAVISIALAIALNYLGILLSLFVTFGSTLLYIATAHLAYKNGLLLNLLYPFAAIIFTYLASWIYKYFIADRKKRELKSAFGHYVNEELVDQISKNPDMVRLGGEKKIVTVFFSDIKDSTAHSEKTPIELWISQVNEYFTVMGNVLKKSGGTLDKYEGDAIMGFWNAPVSQVDHVLRAYTCAIGMRKALVGLHEKWAKEGKPLIEFRIGINTGEALVGNFGSADQFNFTVMGDTVNTASRLESSANKAYGTATIVAGLESFSAPLGSPISSPSPSVSSREVPCKCPYNSSMTTIQSSNSDLYAQCTHNFTLRELDTVYLPGKKEPVKLFELIGLASEATPEIQTLVKTYTQGLAAYRCKDFTSAIKSFTTIQTTLPSFKNDKPTEILLARCQKLQAGEKISELDEQMVFRIQNK